jgi:hypothetical protein
MSKPTTGQRSIHDLTRIMESVVLSKKGSPGTRVNVAASLLALRSASASMYLAIQPTPSQKVVFNKKVKPDVVRHLTSIKGHLEAQIAYMEAQKREAFRLDGDLTDHDLFVVVSDLSHGYNAIEADIEALGAILARLSTHQRIMYSDAIRFGKIQTKYIKYYRKMWENAHEGEYGATWAMGLMRKLHGIVVMALKNTSASKVFGPSMKKK